MSSCPKISIVACRVRVWYIFPKTFSLPWHCITVYVCNLVLIKFEVNQKYPIHIKARLWSRNRNRDVLATSVGILKALSGIKALCRHFNIYEQEKFMLSWIKHDIIFRTSGTCWGFYLLSSNPRITGKILNKSPNKAWRQTSIYHTGSFSLFLMLCIRQYLL